jgi:quinoprotein glucose dehydrogenase
MLRLYALLMGIIGLALTALGVRLVGLGGSAYYVVAGIAVMIAAVLLWRRDRRGAWLYGAMLVGTLVWAIWESGFDGWALAPRLLGPMVFGAWLLMPWTRRALGQPPLPLGRGVLVLAALVVVGGGLAFAARDRSVAVTAAAPAAFPADADWLHYGNDAGGSRYSALAQINAANVDRLKIAWTYHVGPAPAGARASLQVTPLKVGDSVFLCSGFNDVIALDAETGKQRWRFAARSDPAGVFGGTCRGVTYYRVPGATGPCAERIYTATVDARLIALDSRTGSLCPGFGNGGKVDLLQGMGEVWKGYYFVTSAPQLVRGKLVLGGWVTDGQTTGEPSGVVRAFDAVTGDFAWAFDIGRPDQHDLPVAPAHFTRGTPNSWAPMSADENLGLVYVPTGNATPDYYGGHRTANDDRYSSSVVAIDAETGAPRWSFQTTHHDLWDYDVPSQPTLVDLPGGVKGLLQPTKRGEVFFLDRRTGVPIAAVTEKPVPQGAVAGERLSPTQPFSGLPSFAGPPLTEAMMWGLTPIDQLLCRIRFREARYDGPLTPPGMARPTITYPGYLGGIDWGGVSVDRARHLMIVNSSRVANYNRLLSRAQADALGLKPMKVGAMGDVGGPAAQAGTPYAAKILPFLSAIGIPCQQPPYGILSAVDLRTGKLAWTQRFGTARDSGPMGLSLGLPIPMGVPNLGGSVTTGSGLFFIAASQERFLRAFETATGRELWKARLPAGGQATPMTYLSPASGRQFVVIAAGGHGGLMSRPGDVIIAYALPKP